MIPQTEYWGGCDSTAVLSGGQSFQFGQNRYVLLTPSGGSSAPVRMLMPDARYLMLGFSYIVTLNNMGKANTVSVINFNGQTKDINCADGVARAAPTGEQIAGRPGFPAIMIRLVERSLQTWTPFAIGDSRI